jgi:hypothetical protein
MMPPLESPALAYRFKMTAGFELRKLRAGKSLWEIAARRAEIGVPIWIMRERRKDGLNGCDQKRNGSSQIVATSR